MFTRSVSVVIFFCTAAECAPAWAGYYSTFDAPLDTRYHDLDFALVFGPTMDTLATIEGSRSKTIPPPIRRRYLLMEALAQKGNLQLDTLEQKLNFSTVLIRRGRREEAEELLKPLLDEYPQHFILLSHYASACFLSGNEDFRRRAGYYMKKAIEAWPERWTDLPKAEQDLLVVTYGWEQTAFERNRRYEVFFKRFVDFRLNEEKKKARKEATPEVLDPIFTDAKEKPITFLNEQGEFEVGRIATADKERMPNDAVEAVEQLLIWIPGEPRLMWLLAETFNASAMEHKGEKDDSRKNRKIRSAHAIFERLTDPLNLAKYGRVEIKAHAEKIAAYVEKLPDENVTTVPPEITTESPWWRIGIGFLVGIAVGMFALWQIQEIRRRRQGRVN
ncbi:MAG: hypothetical protein HYR84_11070 [Planctomycetes bacterium]|nr:hypothetical protein [Planctomycetota bacterium]